MLAAAFETRGPGCYVQPVLRKFKGTANAGAAATPIISETDSTITSVTDAGSGVYNVVFKPCKRGMFAGGNVYKDGIVGILRYFACVAINPTAGTATIKTITPAGAYSSLVASDVFELSFIFDEGSA